jgi:Ca2+-binding EF-hand superfamily protein
MRAGNHGARLLAATLVLGAAPMSLGQVPKGAQSPTPFRDLFMDLDSNGDRVIERQEVPESGRPMFDRLLKYGDRNKDGKLQAEEFRDLLQSVNWAGAIPPDQREQRFRNLDRNRDGKLDRQEFQGGPARFSQLDRDGDGFLSRDEIPWLNTGKPAPGARPAPAGVDGERPLLRRLESMDRNGDGRVSRKEFTGRPALFDRLDVNRDGYLDKADRPLRQAGTRATGDKADSPDPKGGGSP